MGSGSRTTDERGAVAVLVSLVLLFVVFPLVGLGYTTYVRGALAGELSRSADSGSLAGAASIPVGDLTFVNSYLATNGLRGIALPAGAPDPLVVACDQARVAAEADDGFAEFGWPAPAGGQKLSGSWGCEARYLPDADFLDRFGACARNLAADVSSGLDPTLAPLLGGLKDVLPALLRPGVETELHQTVRGPLDGWNPSDDGDGSEQRVVSKARRRFKNLVVLPTTTVPPFDQPLPLNGAVAMTGNDAIATIDALETNPLVQPVLTRFGCTGLLSSLADDYRDIIDPPSDADAPTVQDELRQAAADEAPLFALIVPADPTGFLGVPFLDFVPICVAAGGPQLLAYPERLGPVGRCAQNAPGVFRATLVDP